MKTVNRHWQIIALGFLGWTLFGVFFALQHYAGGVYFGQPVSFGTTLTIWLICGYAWMFFDSAGRFSFGKIFYQKRTNGAKFADSFSRRLRDFPLSIIGFYFRAGMAFGQPLAEAGKILIETKRENGFVQLCVSDNGAGFNNSTKDTNGIGLKNTRERLEKLYGEKQQFEITSKEGEGLQVKIKIPFRTKGNAR